MDNPTQVEKKAYTRLEWLKFVLFWSWNLIFLAFMSFGFAPVMLPDTFTAVRTGLIPAAFLIFGMVLAIIPVIAVILGLTALRHSPNRLFALGYVVEGPLMLVLAVRFFVIRQATPSTWYLMSIALVGMAAYLWYLLDQRSGERRIGVEALRLCGLTMMVLTSLYAAAWIAFYAIPLGMEGLRALGDFLTSLPRTLEAMGKSLWIMLKETPLMVPFSILGFVLLLYTATLFVLAPILVPYLSIKAWLTTIKQLKLRWGWMRPAVLVAGVCLVVAGVFSLSNQQPQQQAFALLEKPPATAGEASQLLEQGEMIRSGLLNAYLAPFRYLSAEGEVRHISDIYANTFNMNQAQANAIQRAYEDLASPLLYQPVHRPQWGNLVDNRALVEEPQEAARLYQQFFDTPINVAERSTIVRSVRTTWSPNQAEAAWQAVDDREVHLARQELNLVEQGDWADFELFEAYQNQTAEQQEVIYYFNLPESAVLTGVWLSDQPEKSTANSFQVAPRGAAQAVYREETRKSIDPALLEQIGPRQYRLRVFPIPALRMSYDERNSRTIVEDAPQVYMWLSWRELVDGEGEQAAWPLPHLALLRNVYWDDRSIRLVNRQTMDTGVDEWLPKSIPVSTLIEPQAHRVDLPIGQTVLAIPQGDAEQNALPAGLRIAVVVDRSLSMQSYARAVSAALQQLRELPPLEKPVDVYLTASPYRGEEPSIVSLDELKEQDILYFGGQNAAQLLAQFDRLRADQRPNQHYEAVIVLTDGSGYELGESNLQASGSNDPIWVVHLGSDIPLGYDDQTLQAIQSSGGGVTGNLDEALERIAVSVNGKSQELGGDAPLVDLVDGYKWIVAPTAGVESLLPANFPIRSHPPDDPFAALATRRLILAEMQRNRGVIDQLETLDALHALATQYQVVTPYSSMIVLVNQQQQRMLDQLSGLSDRYQREVEALGETTPGSPLPITGVPEPHEWLLLGLAAGLLLYLLYTKRIAPARIP
jgi:putative PEP-CTERM system integral membrane protein